MCSKSSIKTLKYMDQQSQNVCLETVSTKRLMYRNTESLFDDLSLLTETPELCDVKFVVGKSKTPVFGVKSIISTRNRILYSLILAQEKADVREKKRQYRKQSLRKKVLRVFSRVLGAGEKQAANQRPRHLVVPLTEFDPDVFRRILDYVMSGKVTVDVSCVIGVMEAATQFEMEELQEACYQFAQRHISMDNALQLFDCCQLGWQSKRAECVKDQALKFIARNWKRIVRQDGLMNLSSKAFQAILTTPRLRASERSLSEAKLKWERYHGRDLFLNENCATNNNESDDPDHGQSTDSGFRISIDDLINQAELLHVVSMAMRENTDLRKDSPAAHRSRQPSLGSTGATSSDGMCNFSRRRHLSASQNRISYMDNAFVSSALDISSFVS